MLIYFLDSIFFSLPLPQKIWETWAVTKEDPLSQVELKFHHLDYFCKDDEAATSLSQLPNDSYTAKNVKVICLSVLSQWWG
jgi:hypothetical protein